MSLTEQLDQLAGFEPAPYPVVSLYLDTRPNQHGRDQHQAFTRKELKARSRTYPLNSPERESLDKDIERISRFLDSELDPSANSVAVFACSAGELFETIQSTAVVPQHALHIGDRPHLYPLARLESQSPRYAALVTDTNTAHILVISGGELVADREVKTSRREGRRKADGRKRGISGTSRTSICNTSRKSSMPWTGSSGMRTSLTF
jgi:hypothetical protein